MLASRGIAGQTLDIRLGPGGIISYKKHTCQGEYAHVTKGNHADGLPDTETDTRGDTAVEALHAVLGVDVAEGVADSHLLGAVGILLLALHLDADDLDGLVPGAETTTETAGEDLLPRSELLVGLLASGGADPALGETAETEAGAPVGHLADGDGVDALVDAADALLAVDVHEGGEGGLGLDARRGQLVLGDLDRLHAGAETHGGIGLRDAAGDTTEDATAELVSTGGAGVVLGLGGDEEEDGALGGGLDPGPGDKSLVDWALSAPDVIRARGNSHPRTPPRAQMRPRVVVRPSPRWAAMVVLATSSGWPRDVTSNKLRPAPSSRLENLMGFFSSALSPMGLERVALATMVSDGFWRVGNWRALTKGRGCFACEGGLRARRCERREA